MTHSDILRRARLVCGAALLLLASGAIDQVRAAPAVSNFTLANGLQVVVIPDHRTPVVTHMIWYKVGAADERTGHSGIAHFLEHLMFKGTKKNPAGLFSQVVARVGGQENAFTSQDYTGYYQRVPKTELGRVMAFEADRMTGLVLTDDVVKPELQVVLEERNQRIDNRPAARLGEEINAALYRNHPYGTPVIGWRSEMETMNRDEALAFYRRYYAPNNAILVVAGDVTADEVRTLAEDTYGKLAANPAIGPRVRPTEPPQQAARTVTLADPRVAEPILQRSYVVPSYSTAKGGDAEAIEVMMHILGGGANSRLYQALVENQPIATQAAAWYEGSALDSSRMGVYATPRPGVDLPKLEAAIDKVIADLVQNGVTDAELARAKTRLVADAVYAQDSQAALARWYGVSLTTGLTVDAVQHWPDRIRAVTADAVRAAARRYFDKRNSVTGYLIKGPARPVEKHT